MRPQVCSYRCIASYESPLLEAFSLCILQVGRQRCFNHLMRLMQKHNCLGLDATPPTAPDPAPMMQFRGQPLTHEMAEDMFVGWFGPQQFSWRYRGE